MIRAANRYCLIRLEYSEKRKEYNEANDKNDSDAYTLF